MARLSENYELGNDKDLSFNELLKRIQEMYTQLARAINQKADVVVRNSATDNSETFLSDGTIYINQGATPSTVQILSKHPTRTSVIWTTIS